MTTDQVVLMLIFNSLWIMGIHKLFYFEQMDGSVDEYSKSVLWYPHYRLSLVVPRFWLKPLFACPPCMSSVHSLYIYFPVIIYMGLLSWKALLLWPVYAVVLCGIISVLNRD